jgi:predicted dienelactone hydrolase
VYFATKQSPNKYPGVPDIELLHRAKAALLAMTETTGKPIMRTFEILLILVNALALVLSMKNNAKVTWLGIVALNLVVLSLHGLFEGFRYQMAFSYVLVALISLFTLIKTISRRELKTPKVLKLITLGLSLVALVFTAFLAYALPVFTLPKPTGNHAVGVQYLQLVDENRTDPFVAGTTKKRELMVKIYYPAKDDHTKPFSPYFHSPQLVRVFTTFHGLPGFLFDELNLVKTNSKEGLPLLEEEQSYPVVLFSHGAGTSMETQTSQSEDLASHGYIVVAIDHTYVSAASVFPDRTVLSQEATTDFGPDPAGMITQIMAEDASFVIDQLEEMNAGKVESIFKGKLDLEKIGVIGHSVGGAVAYNLAINDPRVKAAIDLDGVVYVTPRGAPADVAPFLMLANDRYHIQAIQNRVSLRQKLEDMTDADRQIALSIYGSAQAYKDAYARDRQNVTGLTDVLKASGNLFTIAGSDHMKFTDMGLFISFQPLREMIGIRGKADPGRCLEITEALTLAFFDQHVKGDAGASLQSVLDRSPELERVELR